MLSIVVTDQVVQQKGAQQVEADTSRIFEFLRMNPPSFACLNTIEDLENFIEELKKVFNVIHFFDTTRFYLVLYHMNGVARTWFD